MKTYFFVKKIYVICRPPPHVKCNKFILCLETCGSHLLYFNGVSVIIKEIGKSLPGSLGRNQALFGHYENTLEEINGRLAQPG